MDVKQARARLEDARQQLEAIAAAGNVAVDMWAIIQEQIAIMALAQQDAADNVAAALAALEVPSSTPGDGFTMTFTTGWR